MFLKVDELTPFMEHCTYAHSLVDVDLSFPLHGKVILMVGDHPWSQPLTMSESLLVVTISLLQDIWLQLSLWVIRRGRLLGENVFLMVT